MNSQFTPHTDDSISGIEDYVRNTSQNAFKIFAGKLQDATSGRRGQLATMGLNLANLTTDKQGINSVYQQHASVIDAYFEYVDLVAMSKKLGVDEAVSGSVSNSLIKNGSLLLVGITIGVAAQRILKRKKS